LMMMMMMMMLMMMMMMMVMMKLVGPCRRRSSRAIEALPVR
jgi:hypothetical protein